MCLVQWDAIGFPAFRPLPLEFAGNANLIKTLGWVESPNVRDRGIDFIQVPTTLLAMVDASVGGKTGINLPEGKNLVGAFHQPRAVVMDLDFLDTLPLREFRAGCAEVIKTAAICDARFFRKLERNSTAILAREPTALRQAVEACVRIKADVVAKDEKESRLRMILNFGHTFGHALESTVGLGALSHGECVGFGMVIAARVSELAGHCDSETAEEDERHVALHGLPTEVGDLRIEGWEEALTRDKKTRGDSILLILLEKIGAPRIVSTPLQEAIFWINGAMRG